MDLTSNQFIKLYQIYRLIAYQEISTKLKLPNNYDWAESFKFMQSISEINGTDISSIDGRYDDIIDALIGDIYDMFGLDRRLNFLILTMWRKEFYDRFSGIPTDNIRYAIDYLLIELTENFKNKNNLVIN